VFSGFLDEFKVSFNLTLKAMIAGAIFAFAGMAAFICGLVVLFLWTLQTYGLMYAWGSVAAVFGVVALFALSFPCSHQAANALPFSARPNNGWQKQRPRKAKTRNGGKTRRRCSRASRSSGRSVFAARFRSLRSLRSRQAIS